MKKNLLVLFCMMTFLLSWTLPGNSKNSGKEVTISFAIDRNQIVTGENPLCTLIIKNTGNKLREIIHPDYDGGGLSFRIINLSTGETSTVQEEIVRGSSHQLVTIAAGAEMETFFSLFDKIYIKTPGEYAVSAIYKINNGRQSVESNVIRIKLRHFSVTNPYLSVVTTSEFDSVFIDPSTNPPEVMMARFNISTGYGLQDIQHIAKAKLDVRPYVSLPPNKKQASHRWFAWMEEDYFKAVFLDGLTEKQVVTQLQLATGQSVIIPPLSIVDATSSPSSSGAALVWMEGNDNSQASIQRINLTLTGEKAHATGSWSYKFPGERPRWMMSHLSSKGDRLMTFIRPTTSGLSLYLLPWPDQNMSSVALTSLIDWPKDEFVATGAILNNEDEICGATLVWNSGQEKKILELITWKVDAEGNGEELYRDVLPWSPMSPISAATVRVRPDGIPAVLMRSDDYKWSVWDSQEKGLTPVPAPYSKTKKYIDISFLNQDEIVIICAEAQNGFSIKRMDGTNLPQSFP